MNARPEPETFGGFGAPPRPPSGLKRVWPFIKAATTRTVLVIGIVAVWNACASEPYRPQNIAGTILGQLMSSEIRGSMQAQLEMQQRMNALNVEMQMRILQAQAIIQQQVASQGGEQTMAQVADMGCIGSMIVGALAQSYNSRDWQNGARNVAQATCGLGGQIRQAMTQEQMQLSHGLVTMASAGFDQHDYKPADIKALKAYFNSLPDNGKAEILAGIDRDHMPSNAVMGDRVMIYYREHA